MILYILNRMRKYSYRIIGVFSLLIMKLLLHIKGVKYGNECTYIGYSTFYLSEGAVIEFADNCIFNSMTSWNLLGINKRCIIAALTPEATIKIGLKSGFSGVSIGAFSSIEIGEKCLCGANVVITDSDWHCIIPEKRFDGPIKTAPVKIGNNVFIGTGSIILKGSIIGDNSVIGAGSVVSGYIPDNVIAAGNPCCVIKKI